MLPEVGVSHLKTYPKVFNLVFLSKFLCHLLLFCFLFLVMYFFLPISQKVLHVKVNSLNTASACSSANVL